MTGWLARRFVKGYDDPKDPAVRIRYGNFAGVVGIVCNVVLCIAKGSIGIFAGSVSIVADAVNNLSDASSNVISLLGFKLAGKPPDLGHPYGHGRYEYLSGLIVAIVIVFIGLELLQSSFDKILNPTPIEFGSAVVCVLSLSIVLKLWMMAFNSSIAKTISSDTLRATAIDSRNDVIATSVVLVCAVVSHLTGIDLDGWVGLGVGVFVIWSGIGLVRDTIDPLLGRMPDPALVQGIHDKIMSYPGVLDTHDLMVHDYGPGRQFASAHVELAAEVDPLVSHDLIDNIEQDFKNEHGMIVTLHYDPIVTDDPTVNDMRNWIEHQAREVDPRLSIHDLRTVPGITHTNVLFDCLKPVEMDMPDDELVEKLAERVRSKYPDAVCKITVDHSYVSPRQ